MTILIMNLLVGLAVDDIKAVQEQAMLQKLAMQTKVRLYFLQVLQYIRGFEGSKRLFLAAIATSANMNSCLVIFLSL